MRTYNALIRIRSPQAAVFWIALAVTIPVCAADQDTSLRPLALVTADTNAAVLRTGRKRASTIYEADELYAGDKITPRGKPVPVMYCAKGLAWTITYKNEVVIPDEVPKEAVNTGERCTLPVLDQTGAQAGDPSKIADPTDEPVANLPPLGQQPSLSTLVTRIALMQESDNPRHAIREVRRLRARYPELVWAQHLEETEALKATMPAPPRKRTQALLIGISTYQNEAVSHLEFAHEDAALFSSYLQSKRGGGMHVCGAEKLGVASGDCEIRLLQNQQATSGRVSAAIDDLFRSRGSAEDQETTLILFVAAHGYFPCLAKADPKSDADPPDCSAPEEDRKTYILTYDSTPETAKDSAYPFVRLTELLVRHASRYKRVLVYLDLCHAGVVPWLASQAVVPPPTALSEPVRRRKSPLGIMTASSRKEEERRKEFAYESGVIKHGVFTHYLVAGLAGGRAPATGNQVDFDGLHGWVMNKVMEATSDHQKPDGKTSGTLIVVDDHAVQDFQLSPAQTLEIARSLDFKNRTPKARGIGSPPFTDADAFVAAARAQARQDDPVSLKRLEVAVEDAGNQVLFDYLRGDQVPQDPKRFAQCRDWFAEALKLAPSSTRHEARMLFCRARAVLDQSGQYESAVKDLQRAIRLDPERAYAYNGLGLAYLQRIPEGGVDVKLATDAFSEALQVAPHWAYPRHNLALTYALTGQYDAAIEAYKDGMKVRPDLSYLPYNLGLLYQKLNMRDEAREALHKALENEKKRQKKKPPKPWTDRAAIESALGTLESRPRRAITHYDKALQDDPDYLPAKHNKAIALARQDQYDAAISLWEQVLKADPSFTGARLAMARAQEQHGELTKAVSEYRTVTGQLPAYIAAYREIARIEVEQQHFDSAADALRTAAGQTASTAVREELKRDLERVEAVRSGGAKKRSWQ